MSVGEIRVPKEVPAEERPFLHVEDLRVWFPVRGTFLSRERQWIRAVDDVTFDVRRGETLAIVGESGSGKTTAGRAIVQLQRPTAGSVWLEDRDLTNLSSRALREARPPIQMVFQDPYASLDPRQKVGDIIAEPLLLRGIGRRQRQERVAELIDRVGLGKDAVDRRPRAFSGGQRQRIGIARALAADPALVVCDEPVSALDVSIQAQIVNLFVRLQREFGLTYVFISHDLAVVRQIATHVAVMYLGRIVEMARAEELFDAPRHPYSAALLSSVPELSTMGRQSEPILLPGDPPSPVDVPSGCPFHTRCWLRPLIDNPDVCVTKEPRIRSAEMGVACHFPDESLAQQATRHHSRTECKSVIDGAPYQ